MKQREILIFKHDGQYLSSFCILKCPSSTSHVIQKQQWPHLHGGVSKGIPKAFPGPPHHTIVILALVLPRAVEPPVQVGCMTSANRKFVKGRNKKETVVFILVLSLIDMDVIHIDQKAKQKNSKETQKIQFKW